jgi:hypothetical protein
MTFAPDVVRNEASPPLSKDIRRGLRTAHRSLPSCMLNF